MNKSELYNLLALEYNCSPTDFFKEDNVLTVSALREGRRVYSPDKYFFHMVTTGGNAVITADEVLHPFLQEFMKGRTGHWLFEIPNLLPLEQELNRYEYSLTQTYHMFLSVEEEKRAEVWKKRSTREVECMDLEMEFLYLRGDSDVSIKWFYGEEIEPFYGDKRFPNAICTEYLSYRPDRIVVCAYDGEEIIGMAGCSEDAPHWMQIGIDVMPGYRSKGVGTYLVNLLKGKILEQGNIPFYGTSVSNYHSWNIALNSGFRPAWVEIGAEKK